MTLATYTHCSAGTQHWLLSDLDYSSRQPGLHSVCCWGDGCGSRTGQPASQWWRCIPTSYCYNYRRTQQRRWSHQWLGQLGRSLWQTMGKETKTLSLQAFPYKSHTSNNTLVIPILILSTHWQSSVNGNVVPISNKHPSPSKICILVVPNECADLPQQRSIHKRAVFLIGNRASLAGVYISSEWGHNRVGCCWWECTHCVIRTGHRGAHCYVAIAGNL